MPQPEVFLFTDTILVFDHLQHVIKVVAHARLDGDVDAAYRQAVRCIDELAARLSEPLAQPPMAPIPEPDAEPVVGVDRTIAWVTAHS